MFLDVCDWQHFDDTGDDDGCDDEVDDTDDDDDGGDDDINKTDGDDGGHTVDVDQHQLNGGCGTHSYGGNNEDDNYLVLVMNFCNNENESWSWLW